MPRGVAKRKKKDSWPDQSGEAGGRGLCLKEGKLGSQDGLWGGGEEDPPCVQPVLGSGPLSEPENLLGEPHECKPSSHTKQSPETHQQLSRDLNLS